MDERIEAAGVLYERAAFNGDASGLSGAEHGLDAVEADVALARGRLMHARFLTESIEDPAELPLFERAAQLYQRLGDPRGEGEALFWVGCFHQVVRHDDEAAAPALDRSRELATRAGDALTVSYALRHLGIAHHAAGRLTAARELLKESTRLRRELGFGAGVAANLVGLAYIAAGEGRVSVALAYLDEADGLAGAASAQTIQGWISEARNSLGRI